jgi:fructokinase
VLAVTDGVTLVVGEALVDLVPSADGALRPHLGGGPFNVARTIARLERPVAFLGALSDDRFGRELRGALDADGVDTTTAIPTPLPTTLAIAELDMQGNAEYRFYATMTSAGDVTPEDAIARIPRTVSALHIGTLGLVLEPLRTAVEAIVRAVPADALIFLDPNCRPGLIDDPAAYRERLTSLISGVDVIKVSDDDLAWLDPGSEPLEAARRLLTGGSARVVLLTLGAQGSVVLTPSGTVELDAPPTSVVDTIGAGDAFGGAFIAFWLERRLSIANLERGDMLLEATRFAMSVASLTCARPGADPPALADVVMT